MDLPRLLASAMSMSDETWQRHASPWSVYTRMPTIAFLLASIWSHTTIGWWAIVAFGAVAAWAWLNPRLFPPPRSTDNWASRATFGERIWLDRARIPIPRHHAAMARFLCLVAASGFFVSVVGAWLNEPISTVAGGCVTFLAKLWFCDRMVWLFENMQVVEPSYRAWIR
jgi:hypothetical protein